MKNELLLQQILKEITEEKELYSNKLKTLVNESPQFSSQIADTARKVNELEIKCNLLSWILRG